MTGLVTGSANLIGAQLTAPPGTRMPFHQSAPPLGWVTDATLDDSNMRVVTGAGGGTGGSIPFSTWSLGGTVNLNTFTISVAQLPVHSHTVNTNHTHGVNGGANFPISGGGSTGYLSGGGSGTTGNTNASGIGVTSPSTSTGSGANITPSITAPSLKLAYYLIAQKS